MNTPAETTHNSQPLSLTDEYGIYDALKGTFEWIDDVETAKALMSTCKDFLSYALNSVKPTVRDVTAHGQTLRLEEHVMTCCPLIRNGIRHGLCKTTSICANGRVSNHVSYCDVAFGHRQSSVSTTDAGKHVIEDTLADSLFYTERNGKRVFTDILDEYHNSCKPLSGKPIMLFEIGEDLKAALEISGGIPGRYYTKTWFDTDWTLTDIDPRISKLFKRYIKY